jgi:hypothetical protein
MNLPADGDTLNVSSIAQAFKACADWIMWLVGLVVPIQGVRKWSATTTYAMDDMVVGPDHLTYQSSVNANVNNTPSSNPGAWFRWGHSELAVQDSAVFMDATSSGITCTNGASVSNAIVSKYTNGLFKRVEFTVDSIPAGQSTTITLGGLSAFASYVITGSCSLLSGGHAYGGQCGMQINISSGANVLMVWHHKNALGDPSDPVSIAVSLLGG